MWESLLWLFQSVFGMLILKIGQQKVDFFHTASLVLYLVQHPVFTHLLDSAGTTLYADPLHVAKLALGLNCNTGLNIR